MESESLLPTTVDVTLAAIMNGDEHVVPSGQHYSGRNRVPNIQQFMDQLDQEKKERDAAIDSEMTNRKHGKEVQDHRNAEKPARNDLRTVRDPVTGKDVQIRDAKTDFKQVVENPMVSEAQSHDCIASLALR